MKALTICQPYAHLIVTPQDELPAESVRKRVENRTWATSYRGPIAIHAGKSRKFCRQIDLEFYGPMEWGKIVGMADLVACVWVRDFLPGSRRSEQIAFQFPWLAKHPHTEGPCCWILENVRRIEPIPAVGMQGLWDWDGAVLEAAE